MTKAIILCLLYAFFNVTGAAIIKNIIKGKSLNTFAEWIKFLFNAQVILALALVFLSALILFKALSSGSFSMVIPVAVGINFIFTIAIGYFIFKDQLNLASFIGFTLIISGIILLSVNNTQYVK